MKEKLREILKPYPTSVCHDCAGAAGGRIPEGHMYTGYVVKCDVCGKRKSCTEPRDFGYPKFKGFQN